MAQDAADAPNAGQAEYWNTMAGPTWAELQVQLDRQLQPLGEAAMRAFAPKPGEAILDIGCGCGDTSFALGEAVSPGGFVLGADISEPMLAIAQARTTVKGSAAQFLLADVQTAELGEARFDGAFSRFGVMFFADPAAAFSNIRRSLKPGGRLAFVCWRPMADNPWMRVPLEAAKPTLPPLPESDPLAPGPFAFADPDRVQSILSAAGFSGVVITPFDTLIGQGDLEQTLGLSLRIGPLAAALRENPQAREAAPDVVRQALSAYVSDDGVKMPAAVWIVRAGTD
jgi:SAM-dependent methyltransferase